MKRIQVGKTSPGLVQIPSNHRHLIETSEIVQRPLSDGLPTTVVSTLGAGSLTTVLRFAKAGMAEVMSRTVVSRAMERFMTA